MSEAYESISKQIKAHKTRWIDYNNRLMSIALENYRVFIDRLDSVSQTDSETELNLDKSENVSYHINILIC